MSFLPRNRDAEGTWSPLDAKTASTLSGSDLVRSPDETSLTDTLIVADPKYSKRPSGKSKFS